MLLVNNATSHFSVQRHLMNPARPSNSCCNLIGQLERVATEQGDAAYRCCDFGVVWYHDLPFVGVVIAPEEVA